MIKRKENIGKPLARFDPNRGKRTFVPSGPVRSHIEYLRTQGVTDCMIARAAGTTSSTVQKIGDGLRCKTNIIVARAIISVSLQPHPQQAVVMNIGCRRRLQALHRMGHSGRAIGDRIGVRREMIRRLRLEERIYLESHQAIEKLYNELWAMDGGDAKTKRWAAKQGWHLPLEWNDIDNPDEQPEALEEDSIVDEVLLHRILRGEHRGDIPKPEREAVLDYAVENGWNKTRVAEILNVKLSAGDQALVRHRRKLRQQEAA